MHPSLVCYVLGTHSFPGLHPSPGTIISQLGLSSPFARHLLYPFIFFSILATPWIDLLISSTTSAPFFLPCQNFPRGPAVNGAAREDAGSGLANSTQRPALMPSLRSLPRTHGVNFASKLPTNTFFFSQKEGEPGPDVLVGCSVLLWEEELGSLPHCSGV